MCTVDQHTCAQLTRRSTTFGSRQEPSAQQRENIQLRECNTATVETDTANSYCEFYMVAELCLGHLQATAISKQRRGLDPTILGDPQPHKTAKQQRRGHDPSTLGDSQQNKAAAQQRRGLDPRTLRDSPQNKTVKEQRRGLDPRNWGILETSNNGSAGDEEATALAATHRLKLKPPTYDGNYATF